MSTTRPTFTWSKAPRAATYELRVYSGTAPVLKKSGVKVCSVTSDRALPEAVDLTWTVRARNGAGVSAWSKSRTFREAAPAVGDIAYALNGGLWATAPDGTGLCRITSGTAWDYAPAWSPDGLRLAYIRRPSRDKTWLEDGVVWLFDASRLITRRLSYTGPRLATATEDLAWSPNGRYLAGACRKNAANRYSKPQVTVLDLQTMTSRVVCTIDEVSGPSVSSLDWSPDSTQLLVCTYWADPGLTYRIAVANGAVLQDYSNGAYRVSWSRTSGNMLLDEFGPDAMYRVQMRRADGGLLRTLWDQSSQGQTGDEEWSATYSPAGSQFAFLFHTGNHIYLRRANLDGSGVVTVRELHPNGRMPFSSLAWK